MLKKRYSAKAMTIIMTVIAFAVVIALYLMNQELGISRSGIVMIVVGSGIIMTCIALSLTKGREAVVIDQPCDYPPEGMNPIQAGCIIDGQVNDRDVIAAFYYLGSKGYMDIIEFEHKHFKFRANAFPSNEDQAIQKLYKAIFGPEVCNCFGDNGRLQEAADDEKLTVKLSDATDRLIDAVPHIKQAAIRKITKKKNREIADLTGKVRGLKQNLIGNRGEKAALLAADDPEYVYKVLPYAYSFAITSKLSANFTHVEIPSPVWYYPYGVADDYKFDVVIYSSMLRNLPDELKTLVFDKIEILKRAGL